MRLTKDDYEKLLDAVGWTRKSGRIDWEAIRDDGITVGEPYSHKDRAAFLDTIVRIGDSYRFDRQRGQEQRLVIICEAAGMVPQLQRIAEPVCDADPVVRRVQFGHGEKGSGDGASASSPGRVWCCIWATRPKRSEHLRDPALVHGGLLLGQSPAHEGTRVNEDLDIYRPEFHRIAVTPDQIRAMRLPINQIKSKDSRAPNWPGAIFLVSGRTPRRFIRSSGAGRSDRAACPVATGRANHRELPRPPAIRTGADARGEAAGKPATRLGIRCVTSSSKPWLILPDERIDE